VSNALLLQALATGEKTMTASMNISPAQQKPCQLTPRMIRHYESIGPSRHPPQRSLRLFACNNEQQLPIACDLYNEATQLGFQYRAESDSCWGSGRIKSAVAPWSRNWRAS